jgi:hypothetical protein
MKYMILLQDSNVVGMCFGDLKYTLYDGDMSIAFIDHQGTIGEMHSGRLISGRFEKQDDA